MATIKKSGTGYAVDDGCNRLFFTSSQMMQFYVDLKSYFNKVEYQKDIGIDKILDKCNKLMNMDIYEFASFVFGHSRKGNVISYYASVYHLTKVVQLVYDKDFNCNNQDLSRIQDCLYSLSNGYIGLKGYNESGMFLCLKDRLNARLENVLDHNTFKKLSGLNCSTFYDIVSLAPYDIINHYGVGKKTIELLLKAITDLICINVTISNDKNYPVWKLN